MYLTMTSGVICGMSLSGPIFASCTAVRNTSVGAIEPRSGRYDDGYYTRMRCRLAPAAVDAYGNDVRYVRVCPDADGRYRITG